MKRILNFLITNILIFSIIKTTYTQEKPDTKAFQQQLIDDLAQTVQVHHEMLLKAKASGNKNWMPGQVSTERYTAVLSGKPTGDYQLAIQLFDKKSGKPVEIGLIENQKNNGYYKIQKLTF